MVHIPTFKIKEAQPAIEHQSWFLVELLAEEEERKGIQKETGVAQTLGKD